MKDIHRMFVAAISFDAQRLATELGQRLVKFSPTVIDGSYHRNNLVPPNCYSEACPDNAMQ